MRIKEFLENVCNEISYKPIRSDISEELELHMHDIKDEYMIDGMQEEDAEGKAVSNMGDASEIGKKLNKIHRPKLEWKVLSLIFVFILIRIFLNANQYMGRYTSWSMLKDIVFIIMGLLIGTIIYFFDYRKSKNFSNIIYILATGILIFQWLNWQFNIDRNISEIINIMFGNEKNEPSILNMNLWYVSVILYIISFAGNLIDNKKSKLIIMYSISVILVYLQSNSITNSTILIIAYLFMFNFKTIKHNTKSKKVITLSFVILFISIGIMLLLECFIGNSVESIYNELTEYNEEKYNLLNNLKWFGGEKELYFTNTNSQFLQLLGAIGIVPSSILICFIILMSIILIRDSLKIQDLYGRFLIIGLGILYITQSIIHILMNLSILPISDVSLPFLSNGNLFFLVNVISFSIIMSVYRRKDIILESKTVLR